MVTTILFIIISTGLILWNGINSSQLVANPVLQKLVLFGSLLAALVSGAMMFEAFHPAAASAQGQLMKSGDSVGLDTVNGGVLKVTCQLLEGVKQPGKKLHVRLDLKGDHGSQKVETHFQVGEDITDMDNPKVSHMATNVGLEAAGTNTRVHLTKISKANWVSVNVAYHPARFPYAWGLITLFVLVVLASAYEGAAPPGWQRTFLTVAISGVTAFIWFIQDGLTTGDSVWTLWIRLAYAIVIGAVVGTFLPSIIGKFLPELKGPKQAADATSPPVSNT